MCATPEAVLKRPILYFLYLASFFSFLSKATGSICEYASSGNAVQMDFLDIPAKRFPARGQLILPVDSSPPTADQSEAAIMYRMIQWEEGRLPWTQFSLLMPDVVQRESFFQMIKEGFVYGRILDPTLIEVSPLFRVSRNISSWDEELVKLSLVIPNQVREMLEFRFYMKSGFILRSEKVEGSRYSVNLDSSWVDDSLAKAKEYAESHSDSLQVIEVVHTHPFEFFALENSAETRMTIDAILNNGDIEVAESLARMYKYPVVITAILSTHSKFLTRMSYAAKGRI